MLRGGQKVMERIDFRHTILRVGAAIKLKIYNVFFVIMYRSSTAKASNPIITPPERLMPNTVVDARVERLHGLY
jgi:hypothetical protein